TPPWQTPPEHGVLSAFGVPLQAPVILSHVPPCRQSSQVMGVPPPHVVPLHFSPFVHASPSSQSAPEFGSTLQPVAGSHEFFVQGLVSVQSSAGPGVQRPPWQVSLSVHLLSSEQGVLLARLVWLQTCVTTSHVSFVQGLLSLQLMPMPTHL